MADADNESSALIAKMLAEDNEYAMATGAAFLDPSSEEDEDDDEHVGGRKKRRKKAKGGGRGRVKANKKQVKAPESPAAAEKKRARPRRWTVEEEKLFLEGLNLYGRDWKLVSAHLGDTRKPRDVASHAQKHFIKLFKDNLPLPEKVRESGEGYTLSGKPLDPDSAAARAYGLHGKAASKRYRITNEMKRAAAGPAEAGVAESELAETAAKSLMELTASPESAARPLGPGAAPTDKAEAADDKENAASANTSLDAAKVLFGLSAQKERSMRRKQEAWEKQQARRKELYGADGRTEYSRNRSRRKAATRFVANPSQALQFVPLSSYMGAPASGPKSQPYHVRVHSSVYATVDLHAHMSKAEVMGLLAGHFDPATLTIHVRQAMPGKSTLDGLTECEMDPVVEVSLRADITARGLAVVGWYHSHPSFQPVPSECDVANQCNYQALFRDEASGLEPFLGLILSPYDPRLPSARSQHAWFYVESPRLARSPKRVDTTIVCEDRLPADARARMADVVKQERSVNGALGEHAVDFAAVWREDADGKGSSFSYGDKLREALRFWLPPVVYSIANAGAGTGKETEEEEERKEEPAPQAVVEDPEALLDDILSGLR